MQSTIPSFDQVELGKYFATCWELFWAVSGQKEMRGHCPIAYFGDIEAYLRSAPRIITVGLNPSHREFAKQRFPGTALPNRALSNDPDWLNSVYRRDLDSYFNADRNPYTGWFNPAFEAVLLGLASTFYPHVPGNLSRAMHTDLFSPVATEPTWSGLHQQNAPLFEKLVEHGVILWQQLVEILQPDIIVASMQRNRVSSLGLQLSGEPTILDCVPTKKGRTCATAQPFLLPTGKRGLLLTGGASRKPMSAFSCKERFTIGQTTKALWQQLTS